MNMNREVFKERQRILNAERQQHFRNQNQKCPSEKKNIPITRPTKKTKKVGNEVNQLAQIPKAHIYPWVSTGLERHLLGQMNHRCGKCGAMMWIDETVNKSSKSPVFTICCANGKVILPLLQELPYPLNILLLENNPHSRLFQIHGEIYHRIGTLLPNPENPPSFAQIYIYDTDHEINNRLSVIPNLDFNILIELQQMLHEINPYVNIFHQAGQLLRNDPLLDLRLAIIDNRTRDS
ncbi:uncharacterized protein LOC114190774 [Rhizophagus irregularis DAOM 181602=DAOM 197198]|nr:uncharacterized protein LOC114190774 [Rhizophagus irregularis DAOM 181602=DAOM 197198]